MKKKSHSKKITTFSEELRIASPFVIMCGVVAIVYFVYRIALVAYPVAELERAITHPSNSSIVCSEEEGTHLPSPTLILSASYQNRISNQKALSSNLITDPTFTSIDQNTNLPTGYTHNVDNNTSNYQYLKDATDGSYYLKVVNTKKDTGAKGTPPAWLPDPVSIESDTTYAYSFQYKSDVPVQVSIEHAKSLGGVLGYVSITTLKPSASWQTFTAHFDNSDGYSSFRPIVNGVGAGSIDTRQFDIHQIASAELPKGVVSVTFDDGWESTATDAAALLDKYHILTTQYIISDVAAHGVAEYMDYNAILRLKQAGNEIGSHSLRHCNQTQLSSAQIQNNAVGSKQTLEAHSLGPVTSFAYPLGQYNQTTQDIYSKQYAFIRSSDAGYNDRYFDETDIHSMAVLSSTKESQLKTWLDYAKAHRQWLVLVYHSVNSSGEYTVTSAQLDQQLGMIAHSGLTVLPLSAAGEQIRR